MRLAAILMLCGAASGCVVSPALHANRAAAANRTRDTVTKSGGGPASNDPRSQSEYQAGLADVLAVADRHDVELLTMVYRLGFTGGELEARQVSLRDTSQNEQLGCLAALVAIASLQPDAAPDKSHCTPPPNKHQNAKYEGERFSQGRLTVARKGTETSDHAVREQMQLAFQLGYFRGFNVTAERVSSPDVQASEVVGSCANTATSLAPAQGWTSTQTQELLDRCRSAASELSLVVVAARRQGAVQRAERAAQPTYDADPLPAITTVQRANQGRATVSPAPAALSELLLFGGTDRKTFLGCLTCGKHDADSVTNEHGIHGNRYHSESIFNRYGEYGGHYSSLSPCNKYASDPPVIVDGGGNFYGYLTVNEHHAERARFEAINSWLAGVCADR